MDKLFTYLTDLSGSSAYFIIFGILVACGLGFPLPEDIPLIAAGYLVWAEVVTAPSMILATLAGVLLGDTILFFLGRRLGLSILNKKNSRLFPPDKVRRTRAYFRKYGDKIVFFARFVAGFRAVAFFMSGAMHLKYRRFILLDALAAILSVPIWIGVGYGLGHFFGDDISAYLHNMHQLKKVVTWVVCTVIAIIIVRMLLKFRKARMAK